LLLLLLLICSINPLGCIVPHPTQPAPADMEALSTALFEALASCSAQVPLQLSSNAAKTGDAEDGEPADATVFSHPVARFTRKLTIKPSKYPIKMNISNF
jgi:hypothetical protein